MNGVFPKKTIIINLFAGPSSGKSILAPRLFSELGIGKPFGEPALVLEFAKLLVYTKQFDKLGDQPFVSRGQAALFEPYIDNVDIIITDSPIELGYIYNSAQKDEKEVDGIIKSISDRVERINFFIERIPGLDYEEIGRVQNRDEAVMIDKKIKDMLDEKGMPYITIQNQYDIASVICHMTDQIGIGHKKLLQIAPSADENIFSLKK